MLKTMKWKFYEYGVKAVLMLINLWISHFLFLVSCLE